MISKNELKYMSGLLKKKFRENEQKFIAEGEKIVEEGLKSNYKCEKIIITNEFLEKKQDYLKNLPINKNLIETVKNQDFKKLSNTVNFQGIAALFCIPPNKSNIEEIGFNKIICLNELSDPGNVGTIIRNCDWFGLNEIILTRGCAEIYNPKTIRASMGSVFHVNIYNEIDFTSLSILKQKGYKFLTADLKGESIYNYIFPLKSLIFFSNESLGPSSELIEISDCLITIPKYGNAESLNVASASAVILSHVSSY
jgi:RNA methyltransferase, TrmH family